MSGQCRTPPVHPECLKDGAFVALLLLFIILCLLSYILIRHYYVSCFMLFIMFIMYALLLMIRGRNVENTSAIEMSAYFTEAGTVSFHNFKPQIFKLSVSNPKSKSVAYLSVLSRISNCQSLGRKNKHEILKTDRTHGSFPIGLISNQARF